MTMRRIHNPPTRQSLSEPTFEQILARAAELDEGAITHVSVPRGRETTPDLAVSPGAWDAALAEHERATTRGGSRIVRVCAWDLQRQLVMAGGSFALGLANGVAARVDGLVETVVSLGSMAVLVAMTVALMRVHVGFRAQARLQVDLVSWWWPFAVGSLVGYGRLSADAFVVPGLCWGVGAFVGGAAIEYLSRADRGRPSTGALSSRDDG